MATRPVKLSTGGKPKGHSPDYYLRNRDPSHLSPESSQERVDRVHQKVVRVGGGITPPSTSQGIDDDTWELVDHKDLKTKLPDDKSLLTPPSDKPRTIEQVDGNHTQKSTALSEALCEKRLLQDKLDERLLQIDELEERIQAQQNEIARLRLEVAVPSGPLSDLSSGAYHTPMTSLENQQTDQNDLISYLQEDIKGKTKQIEEQQSELATRDNKLQALKRKLLQQREVTQGRGDVGGPEGHVMTLTQELSECQELNRKQTQELTQLKRRLDHAEGLEEQLTRLTMNVSTLEEENKELQKQLQLGSPVAQAAVGTHDHAYQQRLRDEIEKLRPLKERSVSLEQQLKAAHRYEQQYREALDKINELKKEIVSLKAETQEEVIPRAGDVADPKDEVSKFRTQLKLKEEAILKLQNDLAASQKMARELSRVKEHSKKQSREVMQLKHEQTAFEVHERERSDYEQSLIDSVHTLEEENRKLLDDLQGANKDRGYLKEALAAAATDREELVTRVQLLEAQMDGLGPKEEAARQQLKSLSDSYRTMQEKYQGMKVENQRLMQQMEKLHTLSDSNAELQIRIDEQQDQISLMTKLKEDLINDLEAARAEALIYKEDFEKERQDRATAFGKMDELREQHAKEMPVVQEEVGHLRKEIVIHQQRLEEVELLAQKKEKEAARVELELRRAQEEVRAKTSQVKQYKKQVDQLKAQVTEYEGNNVRLIESMTSVRTDLEKTKQENAKLSKDIQKQKENQKAAKRKKSDRGSLASPDQPMSMPIHVESRLAETESLYERERNDNQALRVEVEKLRTQKEELYQENVQLRQRLDSSVPPLPPRTSKPSDAGRRSATASPLNSPMEERLNSPQPVQGQSMPQMVGYLGAEHQALHVHSQEKIKQQLQQQFAQGDSRRAKTELLSVGGGGFVPGGGAAATQHGQPVVRAGGGVPTHPGQPRAAVDPRFQSSAGPQPPMSAPLQDHHREAYRQRSHSDTEQRPHPAGLTHPPIPQEYQAQGQAYEMGELHHGVDTAIHHVAEDVISAVDDESGRHIVTQQHIPHDPNLTCPYCEKQFRMGEIQKYRHHVKSCTGTAGTIV